MTAYLLDSSAAVKLYVAARGTPWLLQLASPDQGHELFVVRITAIEIAAALYRRVRAKTLSLAQAASATAALQRDLNCSYRVIEVNAVLADRALRIAEQHGLRGYDCVQLAGAVLVHAARLTAGLATLTLLSADAELNTAALAEGLDVADPNNHP